MDEYKGRTVKKMFQGRYFMGRVTKVKVYKKDPLLYHINYEDGDSEDVEEQELRRILVIGDGGCAATRSSSRSQPSSSGADARGGKRAAPQPAPAPPAKHAPRKRVPKTRTLAAIAETAPAMPQIMRAQPTSGDRGNPTPRFNHRVVYGPHVFIAGQTVPNADADGMQSYTAQTKKVLSMLEAQLSAAGSSKSHMLKVNVILRDIDEGRDDYNAVWEKWINPAAMPVRTTIEGKLMAPDLLVEVDAIAVRKDACA